MTLIIVSLIIFLGVEALPGDLAEAVLGQQATPETVAAFRRELGLDLPPHTRYFQWLGNFLQGDLGTSLANQREISELIGTRLANTIFLAVSAAVISVPIALALGVLAALYRNTWFDKSISIATLSAVSFPEFLIGYILIALLAVQFRIFPSLANVNPDTAFIDRIIAIALPCLTLTLVSVAHLMRMNRAANINILVSPFVEMSKLKVLSNTRV
ncbi:MAG: ABC transporter permease, partial [Proteobacteria bacterium]|nr:ABC transporter permease [Pseudomonadota bacterium]